MRNFIYTIVVAVVVISCNSNTARKADFAKTIENYLSTDKRGTKYDLHFKVIEMNEHGTLTVADSIAYLTDEFRKDKQLIINRIELAKKMTSVLLEREKKQNEIDKYNADIALMNYRIDSLKNLNPDNLNGYEHKNSDDILAQIIRCKYSLLVPGKTTIEETFDFFLSPDGTKCYEKTRVK